MDNEQDISFEEFESALFEDEGNQTDTPEEAVEENAGQAQKEQPAEGEETPEQPEGGEEQPEKPEAPALETFTLKVNKEEKTYSREEMISLAQKGVDYDRVKAQLEKSRQESAEKLREHQELMDTLTQIAKDSGQDVAALLEDLQIGILQKQGLSADVARERLLRQRAEKEASALRASQQESKDSADRAKKEIEDFQSAYPDVEVTQALIDKLMPEVKGGKTLLSAYREMEASQQKAAMDAKEARIAELERQLAAEKQNKENRAASPGSQKDTGGKRQKSEFDDFLEAFS